MGARRQPESGATERLYGALMERPYHPMDLHALARAVGPTFSYAGVGANIGHVRNRYYPYVRRVRPGTYMYTPGGPLDNERYPEYVKANGAKEVRPKRLIEADANRARLDAELVKAKMGAEKLAQAKTHQPEPTEDHVTRVTYVVLGELRQGGVLLQDSEKTVWELRPFPAA